MIRALAIVTAITAAALAIGQQGAPVSYYKQVRPILRKRCQGCHQPASQGGKLVLTTYAALKAGGASGAGFKPGDPNSSLLVRYITGDPPAMPKNQKPLEKADVELIRRWVAEGGKDDTPTLKDPIDATHPPTYKAAPVISALAWSPNGQTLAVSGYREVLLHKVDGSGLIARLVGRSDRIESLAYSPDGKLLAVAGGAPARFGELQFWDTSTNTQKNAVELSYDELYGASFSPEGDKLAVGGADSSMRIVSVPDGKVLTKMDNHSDWVFATCWTMPDMAYIKAEIAKVPMGNTNRPLTPEATLHVLSTGRDQAIKLTVAHSGSFVDDINTHTSAYRAMAGRPGTNQVLAGGDDGIPRLYQAFRTKPRTMNQEDQSLVRQFEQQSGRINAVAFSPDGKRFVVGGEGGDARIYGTDDGKLLSECKCGAVIFALAFRPDGKELAAGGIDGKVRLFNAGSGALDKEFVPVPIEGKIAGR